MSVPSRMRMPSAKQPLLIAGFALLLAGCGGGGFSGSPPPQSATGEISGSIQVLSERETRTANAASGPVGARVFAYPAATPMANLLPDASVRNVAANAAGDFAFKNVEVGDYSLVIDMNNDGVAEESLFSVKVEAGKSADVGMIEALVAAPKADGSWCDISLAKTVYAQGENLRLAFKGYNFGDQPIKCGARIVLRKGSGREIWNSFDEEAFATLQPNDGLDETLVKPIPETWPATNESAGSSYRVYSIFAAGSVWRKGDNFTLQLKPGCVAACSEDADCADADRLTVDSCENPDTCTAACVNAEIECALDSDCDDEDPITTDDCRSPGELDAFCEHIGCPVECVEDLDCNDGKSLTFDACENPATCEAACSNEKIACATDADCEDSNALTIDACTNGGQLESACSNDPCNVACSPGSDCDDSDPATIDSCSNAGTCSAQCMNEACEIACTADSGCDDGVPASIDTCSNPGRCAASCNHCSPACANAADCDDGAEATTDACANPNTCAAICVNVLEPACGSDADCDDGDAHTRDACQNPGTLSALCENTPCDFACTYVDQCNDGQRLTVDACVNPRTCDAACTHTVIACIDDSDCDDIDDLTIDACLEGGTLSASCANEPCDVTCLDDAACDDGDHLTYDACENPATCSAACSSEDIACAADADCDDSDLLTIDACLEGGTLSASCENTPIACNEDSDCGEPSPLCLNGGTMNAACIACLTDADCDDSDSLTIDACLNPGEETATCGNEPCNVACSDDSDCDDGDASTSDICKNPGICDSQCEFYECGNGIVEDGEQCDDGNSVGGDGCSSTCSAETLATNAWITIPAGDFVMGCAASDTQCYSDESPKHTVYLSSYEIQKYEVTNGQYVEFLNSNGNTCDGYECVDSDDSDLRLSGSGTSWTADSGYENHPLVEVTWYGANSYCNWIGGRLPTEAEWEKAARGPSPSEKIYPWGNDSPTSSLANYGGNVGDTTEVGSYPSGSSYYGAMDMAGNVWEWVNDWYGSSYYSSSPSSDPQGPPTGSYRVLRGGSWLGLAGFLRASFRGYVGPSDSYYGCGFRCAQDF